MNKKNISATLVAIATIAMIAPVLAQSNPTSASGNTPRTHSRSGGAWGTSGKGMMVRPAAVGKVTAINGMIITIASQQGRGNESAGAAQTTLTVDATNATIMKNNATSSLSAVVIGDNLFVQGTLTGTNVVATTIRDGMMGGRGGKMIGGANPNQVLPQMQGNGQPIIAGNVSAINGSTLTVTNKSNVIYTVDVTNAKVTTNNTASTASAIVVGDMVIVQGQVNGTSVLASSVIDNGVQKAPSAPQMGQTTTSNQEGQTPHGLFGGIGSFFSRLFGF